MRAGIPLPQHALPMILSDIWSRKRKATLERKRGRLRSRFGGVTEESISLLVVHFRYLDLFLNACGKRWPKFDLFARQAQNQTLVFLVEYRIIAHYHTTTSTWAGLHPRARSTISSISILLILVPSNWCVRQLLIQFTCVDKPRENFCCCATIITLGKSKWQHQQLWDGLDAESIAAYISISQCYKFVYENAKRARRHELRGAQKLHAANYEGGTFSGETAASRRGDWRMDVKWLPVKAQCRTCQYHVGAVAIVLLTLQN